MQYSSYLVAFAWCLALWLVYVYGQHLDLVWLFAVVSRLRRARKARDWSIEEAAWQVGVDTSTYHRWELGVQRPHGRNVRKLEAAFQMRASYLFEKDSFEKELEKLIEKLLKQFPEYTWEKLANQALTGFYKGSYGRSSTCRYDMTGVDIVIQRNGHLFAYEMKSYL
jgi:transcriptional regulator with XRE-family HTH domain